MPAQAGADLRLSVDADGSTAMTLAFGELEGSAVALIRAWRSAGLVSLPSYDPNLFVNASRTPTSTP